MKQYEKVCDVCGNIFVSKRYHAKFCSKPCRQVSSRADYKKDLPTHAGKMCTKCGKTHYSPNYYFCSVCHHVVSIIYNDEESMYGTR